MNVRPHEKLPRAMRLRVLQFAAAVCAIVMAFGLGVSLGARNGWLQPVVKITVVNQTGQTLSQLRVVYTSTRTAGTVELPSLLAGERAVARFYIPGEASYRISGTQGDGTPLQANEAYVEPGYSMTEVLTPAGASSSMQYRGPGG